MANTACCFANSLRIALGDSRASVPVTASSLGEKIKWKAFWISSFVVDAPSAFPESLPRPANADAKATRNSIVK